MINLNSKWVNGQTYGQILSDVTDMKGEDEWEYMHNLHMNVLDGIIGVEFREELYEEDNLIFELYDDLREMFEYEGFSERQLEKLAITHTRELVIIYAVIASGATRTKTLPGISSNSLSKKDNKDLLNLSIMETFSVFYIVDPIFYVMEFSNYSRHIILTKIYDFLDNY